MLTPEQDGAGGGVGYYTRKFMLDTSVNRNRWSVTADSIRACAETFIGCPVVMMPGEWTHPHATIQDAYKVGEVTAVRVLDGGERAEDTIRLDEHAASLVYSGAIRYTSVLLRFHHSNAEVVNAGTAFERTIIHSWIGTHDALVAEPAYGRDKATINHICRGTESECKRRLPKSGSSAGADLSDPTVGQITIVRFIEEKIAAYYQACTLGRIVGNSPSGSAIAAVRDAQPGLTPSEVIATAIAPAVEKELGRGRCLGSCKTDGRPRPHRLADDLQHFRVLRLDRRP